MYVNDLVNALFAADTFRPQSLVGTGNGLAVDVSQEGGNLLNARLTVNDVTGFTSLDVKIQASNDAFAANADDIAGATFTQVVAANKDQIISFQLPTAPTAGAAPYKHVRAVATLVGTSCRMAVAIFGLKHFPNPTAGHQDNPPTIN